jgi:hypothetical protein
MYLILSLIILCSGTSLQQQFFYVDLLLSKMLQAGAAVELRVENISR